jgi:mRNA interferase MazF
MNKDYTIWMPVKRKINNSDLRPRGCKEREIWICNLGENIGFEEDGKGNEFTRPVLILRVFSRKFCHIVPLSTTDKRGKFYYPFDGKTGKTSVALLSQSKPIDTARLSRKVGTMEEKEFKKLKKLIEEILF